jgi:hypothetical protein
MLQLSEKDLNELQAYINKIPTEFGLPLPWANPII